MLSLICLIHYKVLEHEKIGHIGNTGKFPKVKKNEVSTRGMDILEKEVERKLKVSLERIGCLVLKFVSPGNAGVPDRIVILPGGGVLFVELKRPGGKLRPLQKIWRLRFKRLGARYFKVENSRDIDAVLAWAKREGDANEVHTPQLSSGGD